MPFAPFFGAMPYCSIITGWLCIVAIFAQPLSALQPRCQCRYHETGCLQTSGVKKDEGKHSCCSKVQVNSRQRNLQHRIDQTACCCRHELPLLPGTLAEVKFQDQPTSFDATFFKELKLVPAKQRYTLKTTFSILESEPPRLAVLCVWRK